MITLTHILFWVTGCNEPNKPTIPSSPPNVTQTDSAAVNDSGQSIDTDSAEPEPVPYTSSMQAQQTFSFTYSRDATSGNPLKGFITSNYNWGEPANDFPQSMEFAYLPLSAVLKGTDQYDFENGLEPIIEAAAARNHHIIPRIYIDYPNLASGMPEHLAPVVPCSQYTEHGGGCAPDYSSPELQSAILNFIAAFGDTYDGDKRIAFIQLGLLGFWGEWHTYPHTTWFADETFQRAVIDAFDDAFDQTKLQIRYPLLDTPQRDIGFHDDSYAYATVGVVDWFFWSRVVAAGAESNWMVAPMGGEVYPPLQQILFSDSYTLGTYSQDFTTITETTHATYMLIYQAFNMNGSGYVDSQREAAEQAALHMGYEFTLKDVVVDAGSLNDTKVDVTLTVTIQNSGVAPFYYPLTLDILSALDDSTLMQRTGIESLMPSPEGTTYTMSLENLPVASLNGGLVLRLHSEQLLEQQHIRWANETQLSGMLNIPSEFQCLHDGDSFSPGQAFESTGEGSCFCDVDGQFYTTEGASCNE